MLIDKLPKDPFMLMSFVNTKLRNEFQSLDELCKALGISRIELEARLRNAGFEYNEALNKFW